MTVIIGGSLATSLAAAGTVNNPIIAWNNNAPNATASTDVGTEQADGAADNSTTGTTYDYWSAATSASGVAILKFSFAGAESVQFGAIAAHNLGDFSADVRFQYSTDGGSNWTNAAGAASPTDNQAICWYFTSVSAADWRIRIDTGAQDDIVSIGVAYVGNVISMPQRMYQSYNPPITPNVVTLQSNVSEGGHLLGSSVVRRGSRATAPLEHIDPDFLRTLAWRRFQEHFNAGGGFFWAWRPTKYGDVYYAWRDGSELAPANMPVRDLMSIQMGMRLYDEP